MPCRGLARPCCSNYWHSELWADGSTDHVKSTPSSVCNALCATNSASARTSSESYHRRSAVYVCSLETLPCAGRDCAFLFGLLSWLRSSRRPAVVSEQLAQGCYSAVELPRVEPATSRSLGPTIKPCQWWSFI